MFKELSAYLDRNCNHAKLEKCKAAFEQMIAGEKAEAISKVRKRRQKTHGTKR
jgi:hypothetical protein